MHTRWIRRLAGVTGLVAVFGLAQAAETTLPNGTANELIKSDIAFLQKGLAKEPQRKELPGLKAAAMMVAAYAQSQMNGPDAAKMAGLRDQALKVAEALAEKEYAKAKDAAKGLETPAAGMAGKKLELHKLHKFDISEAMAPFRSSRSGGMDLERSIRNQAKSVTNIALVKEIGGKSVILGEFTMELPSGPASSNAAKRKQWNDFTKAMIDHAQEIVTEASKPSPNKDMLKKKLFVLDASCTNCHNAFRD